MTVSGRKQSTAQVISNPPAPAARLEENGKECEQRLDNVKERGNRMERKGGGGEMRRGGVGGGLEGIVKGTY